MFRNFTALMVAVGVFWSSAVVAEEISARTEQVKPQLEELAAAEVLVNRCLLYTSPSPRDSRAWGFAG